MIIPITLGFDDSQLIGYINISDEVLKTLKLDQYLLSKMVLVPSYSYTTDIKEGNVLTFSLAQRDFTQDGKLQA
jgi:hypothetical protein